MRSTVASYQKLTITKSIIKADPLITTWDVAKELNVDHAMVVQHLEQFGKVKKLDKWVSHKLTKNQKKLSFWGVIFSYSTQQQWTISRSESDMWRRVDFIDNQQPPAQRLEWEEAPKHFPKPNLHQSRSSSPVVCCPSDPLQLSESRWNHYVWEFCSANWWDVLKTEKPAASIGQQKGPSSPRQHLMTACCTTNISKVEWIGLQGFASSIIFTWPLATDYYFFKHLDNFFVGEMFGQPAWGRKCFTRVRWIPKHGFLCSRNKQTYFLLAKMCWL